MQSFRNQYKEGYHLKQEYKNNKQHAGFEADFKIESENVYILI